MVFINGIKEKVINILKKVPALASDLPQIFGNRMFLLIGLGGSALLLLILLISIAASGSRGRRIDEAPGFMPLGFTINSEDLFLPSEPDFFPEFILEQEPRSFWVIDDIRPHWRILSDSTGNAESSTEIWRNQIQTAVDRLMDGVP